MEGFAALAILYLILPNLVFLLTWTNPWIGLPCTAIVTYCCIKVVKSFEYDPAQKIDRKAAVFVFCLALFWTVISGAGGLIPQFQGEDYIKHNLLFNDLISRDWPVIYNSDGGGKNFLCYSLGYYLVPAFIARCLGAGWISVASFLWTFLGAWLFFFWVANFNRKAPVRTLLIFLFFAGLGIVWFFLRDWGWRQQSADLGLTFSNPDWWTKISYAPQHTLAAWLGSALLYDRIWLHRNPRGALFIWALTLFWSPFSPLGMLLIPFLALRGLGIKSFMESVNIIGGGVILLILGIYYKAHAVLGDSGWIWSHGTDANWFLLYVVFTCIQIIFSVLCIFFIDRKYDILQNLRPLFLSATLVLILLPLYKVGHYNDLRLQVSGPLLVFVSLSAAACLTSEQFTLRRPLFLALAVVYLVGAFYPVTRPWYCISQSKHDYSIQNLKSAGTADLSQLRIGAFDASAQYLGKTDSPAYRYLLKH